jgi:hypothetical protein
MLVLTESPSHAAAGIQHKFPGCSRVTSIILYACIPRDILLWRGGEGSGGDGQRNIFFRGIF